MKILGFATQANINPADVCNEIGQAINGKPNRFKMDLDGISGVRFGNNTYRI